MKGQKVSNPFRIHGVVEGDFFTNRTDEIGQIFRTLSEPGSKLLVYGPRRMGKTSAILQAVQQVNQEGGCAFLADLSTASTAIDMGNRIMAAATQRVGKKWKNLITDIVSRMKVSVSLNHDPSTGLMTPSIDLNLRKDDLDTQRKTLSNVLDALNEVAKARKLILSVALDEFQEIHKFGGETAEWDLRATIQHHHHIGYVLAGSREHIIHRMIVSQGALYKMVDKLAFGPIDPTHLAKWIDLRIKAAGLETKGAGSGIVQTAGPRTRDIIQLARKCYDLAVSEGSTTPDTVKRSFDEIVSEESDLLYACWHALTRHQQNVLRAVAANQNGLTTQESLARFSLGQSGTVTNTEAALIKAGHLVREDAYTGKRVSTPVGYEFDNPFFKAWVIRHTLTDIGIPSEVTDL